MGKVTQANRLLGLATSPLGKDQLLLTKVTGSSEIFGDFEYALDILSDNKNLQPKALMGKPISFYVEVGKRQRKYVHGIVASVSAHGQVMHDYRKYTLGIAPKLWFTQKRSNCRIFQNLTAIEIVSKLLKEHSVVFDGGKYLTKSYVKRDYCVQYRESDYAFIHRLLEEEGVFYFYEHEKTAHTLFLSDDVSSYREAADFKLRFNKTDGHDQDMAFAWFNSATFPSGQSTYRSYDFEAPTKKLAADKKGSLTFEGIEAGEVYDFENRYVEPVQLQQLTDLEVNRMQNRAHTAFGESYCRSFEPCRTFKWVDHTYKHEIGQSYVITRVRLESADETHLQGAGGQQYYRNVFECLSSKTRFIPQKRIEKPRVPGVQTAVVCGPAGDEIYVDRFGRVKVQFYWDREGKRDEKSSCWIRVSQNWAGENFGVFFHPRIGQEVLVDFLNGDLDQPIIVGRVYNGDQPYPHDPAANKTQSGIKTHSSKDAGSDAFNELLFDDKKGEERIYIQAQKDMSLLIKNDESREVKHNRTAKISDNDSLKVGKNITVQAGSNIEIDAGSSITIKTGAAQIKMSSSGSIEISGTVIALKAPAVKLN